MPNNTHKWVLFVRMKGRNFVLLFNKSINAKKVGSKELFISLVVFIRYQFKP